MAQRYTHTHKRKGMEMVRREDYNPLVVVLTGEKEEKNQTVRPGEERKNGKNTTAKCVVQHVRGEMGVLHRISTGVGG